MTFTKYNDAELKFIKDSLTIETDDEDYNDDESEDFFNYYNKE